MRHDELLAKINNFEPDDELDACNAMNALIAVVELHKPSEQDYPDEPEHCVGCQEIALGDYPCPTIQAIEKGFI